MERLCWWHQDTTMLLTARVDSPLSNASSSQHACSRKSSAIPLCPLLIVGVSRARNGEGIDSLRARLHQRFANLAQHVARIINIIYQEKSTARDLFGRSHAECRFDVLFLLHPVGVPFLLVRLAHFHNDRHIGKRELFGHAARECL